MSKPSKATEDVLDALHGALAKELMRKVKSGEATAADLSVVRQFLKDNNIDAVPRDGSPLNDLVNELPFQPGEDPDEGLMH